MTRGVNRFVCFGSIPSVLVGSGLRVAIYLASDVLQGVVLILGLFYCILFLVRLFSVA